MKKRFTPELQKKLRQAVEEIESTSGIEVVAAMSASCGKYREGAYPFALVGFLIAFTLVMYLPHEFHDEYIYFTSLAGAGIGWALGWYVHPLRRIFVSKKAMEENVKLHAQATFHRNHLHETKERIGTLIFVSWYEKTAILLFDKGAEGYLPKEDQARMHQELATIFQHTDPSERLLQLMASWRPLFDQYIIRAEDDINELPDHIEIV